MARKQRRSKQPQQPKTGQEPSKRDWYRISAEARAWVDTVAKLPIWPLAGLYAWVKNWLKANGA